MKNRAVMGILVLVAIFFVVLIILATYTVKAFRDSDELTMKNSSGQIAVVEVDGAIFSANKTIEKLVLAEEDKEVKAIIVRIDSPGGAVGPVQEIYEEIRRIDEIKPVFASFGAIAASGGYYIGAAARRIYSNPGTLTGSIGVIMEFVDLSKLLEYIKVSPEIIKAGRYKDMGQPTRSLTKEETGLMEGLMSGVHKQFVNDILKRRKDVIKGDIWELAQGQIFSGEEAKKQGLVDELAGLWMAGRSIHNELQLKGKFSLKYIKIHKKASFWKMIENLDETISKFDISALVSNTPMLLYSR